MTDPSAGVETTQRFELVTGVDGEQLGILFTGLLVVEGTSSDPFDVPSDAVTLNTRDVLSAVPIIHWELPDQGPFSQVAASMHGIALDGVDGSGASFPLALASAKDVSFSVSNDTLRLYSKSRHLGLFGNIKFPIQERLTYFLEKGGTLGVVIVCGDTVRIASVVQNDGPTLVGFHHGSLVATSFPMVVDRSVKWTFGLIGNPSILAGGSHVEDAHFSAYLASSTEVHLPTRIRPVGGCLACGADEKSNEHCTPNWLARSRGVQPVTAPIFCVQCNNYFGETLESKMADWVNRGVLSTKLDTSDFVHWAIKTALTLSVASGVRISSEWMYALRSGDTPTGFEVFASTSVEVSDGYYFNVTRFGEAPRRAGYLLFTFATRGLAFAVVRFEEAVDQLPQLERIHPDRRAPSELASILDLRKLHESLIEGITKLPMKFTPSTPKPASPYTRRKADK